ncbi:MAG TPA: GH3 auxin-responsive promoter family protein [Anaeromyxobacteraceae bacterium]|nr:GH3 auxin-responsive promoter family protein [Anaeromyxobacteraceae bacterium]
MRRAVSAWLADQALRVPALLGGPAYWSLSPAAPPSPPTAGGIPVGFEDDAEYLGPVARRLAGLALAVPGAVRHLVDVEAWRRRTLLHLVRARELRLISVWSPSFLPLLLAPLPSLLGELADEVGRGSPALRAGPAMLPPLPPDRRRARELLAAGPDPLRLWPRLALVSAWTDGPSAAEAARLAALLPGVPIEGKGLAATEAVVSIPFGGARPLAVTSHFIEVETPAGEKLVHELREGDAGTVVVTTGAGLWRYRLQDRIEVTGFAGKTPAIRFLGKEDQLSDLFGEKLHAGHAAALVERLRAELRLPPGLAFLAPDRRDGRPCYTLFVAAPRVPAGAAARLEALLAESFHYAHCVRLGQLAPARLYRVEGDGLEPFFAACAARGQRLGDVKPSPLRRDGGWAEALPGGYAGER